MRWTDINDIVYALEDKFPEIDIMSVRYTDLWRWVTELEGFMDTPQRCNEKILEAIQMEWIKERA